MRRLAIVVGLVDERTVLQAVADSMLPPDDRPRILVAAGSAARAEALAREAVADGAEALASVGVAGALVPTLRPGAVVLPETVRLPDGRDVSTDRDWRLRLIGWIIAGGGGGGGVPVPGRLFGSDQALTQPADKAAAARDTGAVAVDMESHGVARAAEALSVPFLVARVIADPAERAVPGAALAGMRDDGKTAVRPVLKALKRQPGDLPGLLRLAIDFASARRGLRRLTLHGRGRLALD